MVNVLGTVIKYLLWLEFSKKFFFVVFGMSGLLQNLAVHASTYSIAIVPYTAYS